MFWKILLGDGNVSISISESSSSVDRRIDEFVLFDSTGVDDEEDDGGGVKSTECCRALGVSGTKALIDWVGLTSNAVVEDGDGVEYDRSGDIVFNVAGNTWTVDG